MTYPAHHSKWQSCTACPLKDSRTKVCTHRRSPGKKTKLDLMFIGEAPGVEEDIHGEPFIGPSGKFLQRLIVLSSTAAFPDPIQYSYVITNVVCCKPPDDNKGKLRAPTKQESDACHPRFIDLLDMADPKGIIALGETAAKHLNRLSKTPTADPIGLSLEIPVLKLKHPAWVLRQDPSVYTPLKIQMAADVYNFAKELL